MLTSVHNALWAHGPRSGAKNFRNSEFFFEFAQKSVGDSVSPKLKLDWPYVWISNYNRKI